MMRLSLLLTIVAAFFAGSDAFMGQPIKPAFAISTTSPLQMTVISYKGKKKNFPPGSPLSKAVSALGVKVTYSCKKGDCATCQISLAGRMTKPCVAKVPAEPKLKSLQEKGLEIKG